MKLFGGGFELLKNMRISNLKNFDANVEFTHAFPINIIFRLPVSKKSKYKSQLNLMKNYVMNESKDLG